MPSFCPGRFVLGLEGLQHPVEFTLGCFLETFEVAEEEEPVVCYSNEDGQSHYGADDETRHGYLSGTDLHVDRADSLWFLLVSDVVVDSTLR